MCKDQQNVQNERPETSRVSKQRDAVVLRSPLNSLTPTTFFTRSPFFGCLKPVPGSISVVPVDIKKYTTTFGRDPSCDFRPKVLDEIRVPKTAFEIQLWYSGIEKDLAAGRSNYVQNKDLTAIISIRTSRYIKINDVILKRGVKCWLYGELRTDDVITIFEDEQRRNVTRNERRG